MTILTNKKIVILGDRNGIPSPYIEECVRSAPLTEIVFSTTECYS